MSFVVRLPFVTIILLLSVAAILGSHPIKPAIAQPVVDNKFQDFMGMEVCEDASGKVQAGVAPTDSACHMARKLRPGEALPYHLTNWGGADAAECRGHVTIHDNVPIIHDGVKRDVSIVRVGYSPCGGAPPVLAFVEVHTVDGDDASILGSWARGNPTAVSGGVSDLCASAPHSSRRFFRQWMLGASSMPPEGEAGYGVLRTRAFNSGLPPLSAPCPSSYTRFLAIWSEGMFKFRSGSTLLTMVSHPYSQADVSGTTPGDGRQMERTYWTREFGQTRWEAWKRDDFVNGKTGHSARQDAVATFASHVCSKPFDMPANPTPGITLGPVTGNGVWAQTLTDRHTGETHTWYMAECLDLTNIVRAKGTGGDPFPDLSPMPAQFWDFWKT